MSGGKCIAALVLVAVTSCTMVADEVPGDPPLIVPAVAGAVQPQIITTRKPDFIDEDGSRYIWQRTVVPVEFDANRILREEDKVAARKHTRIKDLSVPELARKLRSRMYRDGEEYLLDHDPIELAERVYAALHAKVPPPTTPGRRPNFEGLRAEGRIPPAPEKPGQVSPKNIIGSDDRVSYDHAGVSWPAMTALLVEGRGCTATVIGKRMASSAAHCFYDSGGVANFGTMRYIPFASNTPPTEPYGSFTAIAVYWPVGWDGSDWAWDFAQVRFAENTFSNWGWVGTEYGGYDENPPLYHIWGYPLDKPHPQLWLKSGYKGPGAACPGYYPSCGVRNRFFCDTRQAIRHNIDIMPGDSGAGVIRSDTVNMLAIQSTQWRTGTLPNEVNWPNEARVWDSTTYLYFAGSGLWP